VTPLLIGVFPTITPNQVTIAAFAVAIAAAATLAAHAPIVAAVLITAASVLDGSDGEIARLAHRSSRFGAFFDAVLDRAADGALFTGAAIYLATAHDLAGPLGSAQVPVAIGSPARRSSGTCSSATPRPRPPSTSATRTTAYCSRVGAAAICDC